MADEAGRQAERHAAGSGAAEDRARHITTQVRSGQVPAEMVELAAFLGDAAARIARPDFQATLASMNVEEREDLGPLLRWSAETLARLCFAAASFRLERVPPGIGGRDDPFARVQHAFRSLQHHFRAPSDGSVEGVGLGSGSAGSAGWGDHVIRGQPGLPEAQRAHNSLARAIERTCMLLDPEGGSKASTALTVLGGAVPPDDWLAFSTFARDEVAPWVLGETDPTDRWLAPFAEGDVDPRAARARAAPTGHQRLRAALERFDASSDLSALVLAVTQALQAPIPERATWRLEVMGAWRPLRWIEVGYAPREGLEPALALLRSFASPRLEDPRSSM